MIIVRIKYVLLRLEVFTNSLNDLWFDIPHFDFGYPDTEDSV